MFQSVHGDGNSRQNPRRNQIGDNVSKKDKIKFLITTVSTQNPNYQSLFICMVVFTVMRHWLLNFGVILESFYMSSMSKNIHLVSRSLYYAVRVWRHNLIYAAFRSKWQQGFCLWCSWCLGCMGAKISYCVN